MGIARYFDLLKMGFFVLLWVVSVRRLLRRKNGIFLFFFTLLFGYLYLVLDYTLFRFQSLLLLKLLLPNLMLNGVTADSSINLVPLVALSPADITTSLLNVYCWSRSDSASRW